MMKERIDENHSWVTDDDLNYTEIVLVFLLVWRFGRVDNCGDYQRAATKCEIKVK